MPTLYFVLIYFVCLTLSLNLFTLSMCAYCTQTGAFLCRTSQDFCDGYSLTSVQYVHWSELTLQGGMNGRGLGLKSVKLPQSVGAAALVLFLYLKGFSVLIVNELTVGVWMNQNALLSTCCLVFWVFYLLLISLSFLYSQFNAVNMEC